MDAQSFDVRYLDYIDSRVSRLEATTVKKSLSWLVALIIALAINIVVIPYVKHKNVPYLATGLNAALDVEKELSIDLGVFLADKITGTSRSVPTLEGSQLIIGMSRKQSAIFAQNVKDSESHGGRYGVVNQFGYSGAYQFGASALADVGLIKKSAFKSASNGVKSGRIGHYSFLTKNSNWTIKGGLKSFLSDRSIQDTAFVRLTNKNIKSAFKARILHKNSSVSKIAGFAKAAHLGGASAAKRWYKYKRDSKDGNGTKVSTYAKQGEKSIQFFNFSSVDDLVIVKPKVHHDLMKVFRRAQQLTSFTINIKEGVRDAVTQKSYFKRGASQTLNSRHLTGHALDLEVEYRGKKTDKKDWFWCRKINTAMQQASRELQVPIKWGGNGVAFLMVFIISLPGRITQRERVAIDQYLTK